MGKTLLLIGVQGGVEHDGDKTVAQIGAIHEYGNAIANIPARPFIRPIAKDKRNSKRRAKAMVLALKEGHAGHAAIDRALGKLGVDLVGKVKKRIAAGINPPLQQSTIDRKNGNKKGKKKSNASTPLIDTGNLRAAITHKVVKK